MKDKKYLLAIPLVIWMVIIFLFSNQNATKSESLSDRLVSTTIDIVVKGFNIKISGERKETIIDSTRFWVRKTAHFTSYFILGILAYLIFSNANLSTKKVIIYTLLLCFLYACSDEFHQLFSLGRTARFLDVLIDTSGSICACLIAYYLNKEKKHNALLSK